MRVFEFAAMGKLGFGESAVLILPRIITQCHLDFRPGNSAKHVIGDRYRVRV